MNPIVEQIRAGTAPQKVRAFAAEGLIPITEDELIPLQIFLLQDHDRQIAEIALSSLHKVSEQTWIRLLGKKDPDPQIVDFCIQQRSFPDRIKETILLNHSVPDELIQRVAASESGPILDLIISNQVRLLRGPAILTALERNNSLTFDQKRRIVEFKTEFLLKKQTHQEVTQVQNISFEDILARIPSLDIEAQRIIQEVDNKPSEEQEISDEQVEQTIKSMFSVEELEQIPSDIISVYQRILKMKKGEKIRVALLGTKEERAILIRDGNKQISSMVIRSPKLTEPEMENFAQFRNIDSDLLRQMGLSREFLKKYTVIHYLVKNPKTPSSVALNLLKLLRDTDLRNLTRDRNVPEIVRRRAKQMLEEKDLGKR